MSRVGLLSFAYRLPGILCVSARISKDKTVIVRVEPEEVATVHESANAEFTRAVRQHLTTFGTTGLQIVGPPIEKRKAELQAAIASAKPRYDELVAAVTKHWPTIASRIDAFNIEYAAYLSKPRNTDLDTQYVERRFRPQHLWLPFDLPPDVESQLFTEEEQAQIRKQIEDTTKEAYAKRVERYLEEMAQCLETGALALQRNDPMNGRTVERLGRAFKEIGNYLPHTGEAEKYMGRVDALGELLGTLKDEHDAYKATSRKKRTLDGLSAAIEAAISEVKPLLADWTETQGPQDTIEPGLACAPEPAEVAVEIEAMGPAESAAEQLLLSLCA